MTLFFIPFTSLAKPVFIILLACYLFFNLKWLDFMRREAGAGFAVKALFLNYLLGIEIMLSALYGFISYPFIDKETLPG